MYVFEKALSSYRFSVTALNHVADAIQEGFPKHGGKHGGKHYNSEWAQAEDSSL